MVRFPQPTRLSVHQNSATRTGYVRTGFRRADKLDTLAFSAVGFRDAAPEAGLDLLVHFRRVA